MPECFVQFQTVEDVREFVSLATRFLHPVQVTRGNYSVSATSIMGLFSMGLNRPLRVTVLDRDADPSGFFSDLGPFRVA